jgi:hypothetical protein
VPGVDTIGKLIITGIDLAKARGMVTVPLPLRKGQFDDFKAKKVKTKDDADCKFVLKLCDAEDCLDATANAGPGVIAADILTNIGKMLAGGQVDNPLTGFCDKAAECMKKSTLRQDTVRRKRSKDYYARPAKGHGKGRVKG